MATPSAAPSSAQLPSGESPMSTNTIQFAMVTSDPEKNANEDNFTSNPTIMSVEPLAAHLTGTRLYLLGGVLAIASIMMALDVTILAPAIPKITTTFHTLSDIGWYSSSYLLSQLCFQPLFSRFYVYFPPKQWYIVSVLIFMLGSIICAVSQTSAIFILGRVVAGCGGAGLIAGAIAIFGSSAPMRERPRGLAIIAGLQSVAYLGGPAISGAFTDSRLTWRFCFWINLPIGFISLIAVFFLIKPRLSPYKDLPLHVKLLRIDPSGAILFTSSFVCLFIALERGGISLAWSSSQVWGCILGFGLIFIAFVILQVRKKDHSLIPIRIIGQRTIYLSCIFSFLYAMAIMVHNMLLPTYLQTVHSISAVNSGLSVLPMAATGTAFILIAGFTISAYGYHIPFLRAGPIIYLAGSVLFHRLSVDSTPAQYLGYQVIAGAGFGMATHAAIISVLAVIRDEDISTACGIELISSLVGGAVGASLGQNLFVSILTRRLGDIASLEEAEAVAKGGLDGIIDTIAQLEPQMQTVFRLALNDSVTTAFTIPIAVTALAAVVSWFIPWNRIDISKQPVEKAREIQT